MPDFLSRAVKAAKLAGRVTVLLTNDEQMRHLNRVFRHKDKATDVLSFPALEMNGNKKLAGDLAISVEMAAREAKEREHPLHVELKILAAAWGAAPGGLGSRDGFRRDGSKGRDFCGNAWGWSRG